MFDWLPLSESTIIFIGVGSAVVFVGTLLIVPLIIIAIPQDYFCHKKRETSKVMQMHPFAQIILMVIKNLLALTLIAAGVLMLILPGQGLLTIVAGLLILDFPRKYQLEQAIVQRESIFTAINWIRNRANKPPLILDKAES